VSFVGRHFRIRLDLLQEKIADDRSKVCAFLAVASAGTTNTGAVDDLSAMADCPAS